MKKVKAAIVVYIVVSISYLFAAMCHNDELAILSKPIVSSSMIFYFFQERKGKVNYWQLLILFLLFFSGVLNLFDDSQAFTFVLYLNILAYIVLLGTIAKALFEMNIKKIDHFNLGYILLMVLFLFSIFYGSVFLVFDKKYSLYYVFVCYGIVLTLVGILVSILFVYNNSLKNLYLMLAVFCFIICDSFYAIYYYYYGFLFLRFISILSNSFSYYFLVQSFVTESKKEM
ncbi:MAG: hypothetical protein QM535_06690 [Limnohabitans sp.]|nr:hypothetical protein [Limnohabitans sp.]